MLHLRDLPPVDEPIAFDDRNPSQTFLRHHERCPRAAYLYRKYNGGAGAHELHRGIALHEGVRRGTLHVIEHDEHKLAPDLGREFIRDVFREHPELVMPSTERDSCRAMMFNWCEGSYFHPDRILGVELPITLEIGGWTIRMRLDLAESMDPWTIHVTDYKTAFPPPKLEFEKEELFQLQLYTLGLVEGRVEGFPAPIGLGAKNFRLKEIYPRILRDDGCARREIDIGEEQLLSFKADVIDQLARLEKELQTQKWQAVPGDHCAECPSAVECPLPRHLRPMSQAAELDFDGVMKLAAWWDRTTASAKRVKGVCKAWSKANGGRTIPYGKGIGFGWRDEVQEKIKDKANLRIEIEGAVEYGHPFRMEDHVTTQKATKFDRMKMDTDEEEPADA